MGPLNLEQFREKLSAGHPERKLATVAQLWEEFGLRFVFLESEGANAFVATAISETGAGPLREVTGMISLQLTPFREITGLGMRERTDSTQLILALGEKEMHLSWPGPPAAMLEDATCRWIIDRWRAAHSTAG